MDTRTTPELTRRLSEIESLLALYKRIGNPDTRHDIARLSEKRNQVQALLCGRRQYVPRL